MEADSDKQNMRVIRNGNASNLQFYRNRFQQILNSKIPNSEESIETKEFENSFFETTEEYDFKETEDIKEESCNPWNVKSFFEFGHFCCPECDFITSSNISKNNCSQDFIDHVSNDHPWAISYLQKISDGSVKNMTLCTKVKEEPMDYEMSKNKFIPHEINLVEKESYKDPHETNVTSKLVVDPISDMKHIGENNVSEKKMEDSNNDIEDTQENNATTNDTDSQNSTSNKHLTKSEMTIKDPIPDKQKKRGRKRKNEDIAQENELKDKAYKCETCGKSYMIYTLLQNHISIVHDRKKRGNEETTANEQKDRYECDICGKYYMQYSSLKKHIGVVHEGKREFSQRKKQEAKEHKEKSNKMKQLNCGTCGQSYNSGVGLKRHIEFVHEGKELFNCDRCPKKFSYKDGLEYHYIKDRRLKNQGIDETNFNIHSENPLVAKILRQKSDRFGNAPLL